MTKWGKVVEYFRSIPTGWVIRRQTLLVEMKAVGLEGGIVETYRLYLTRAGYLRHSGIGLYVRTSKRMRKRLTVRSVYAEAYPTSSSRIGPSFKEQGGAGQ